MPPPFPNSTQQIIDRLAAVDVANPRLDRPRVEAALRLHYERLGVPMPPIEWAIDAERGYLTLFWRCMDAARGAAWDAARDAAWDAAWGAAWGAAWDAARGAAKSPPKTERCAGIWLPFVDAYDAGLWLWFPTPTALIVVPRPAIQVVDNRLHAENGPAVAWPNGSEYFYWRGVRVPPQVITAPETLTAEQILAEENAEVRRVMLERFGHDRFLVDLKAEPIHSDAYGDLFRVPVPDDEPLVMVRVINSTPEPSWWQPPAWMTPWKDRPRHKRYFLRVHPELRPLREDGTLGKPQELTALNAVASTFGKRGGQYALTMET